MIILLWRLRPHPEGIDFPIPGNDDAIRSIKLFTKRIADVWVEEQEMKKAIPSGSSSVRDVLYQPTMAGRNDDQFFDNPQKH